MTFYHGTRRGFRRGGVLFPRGIHGGSPTTAPGAPYQGNEDWVYVTRDLNLAWVYAWHAAGRGRPKVLVVQPMETVERDPEHSLAMDAWRCPWARVEVVLTEPTVTEEAARSGWLT